MTRQAYGIIDLQFGSTSKGILAGVLAEKRLPDTICTAWGANAGYTYIDYSPIIMYHTDRCEITFIDDKNTPRKVTYSYPTIN